MSFLKPRHKLLFFLTVSIVCFSFSNNLFGQEKRNFLLERFEGLKETITKTTTKEELNDLKHNLGRQGVVFNYSNLKYNSKKEIIRINIHLRNKKSKFSGEWNKKNIPIPTIKIGEENGIIFAKELAKSS